jgi:hypothetical protein
VLSIEEDRVREEIFEEGGERRKDLLLRATMRGRVLE